MWVLFKIVLFPILLLKPISLTFSWCNKRGKDCFNGPRCVSLSREGNFITYNFFISLREKIFSKLLLRTWWLMPNIFSSTCSKSAKFTILIQGMFLSTVSFLLPTLSVHITTGPFLWNGRKTQLLFDDRPVNLIFLHILVLHSSHFSLKIGSKCIKRVSLCTVHWSIKKSLKKISKGYIVIELYSKKE